MKASLIIKINIFNGIKKKHPNYACHFPCECDCQNFNLSHIYHVFFEKNNVGGY